MSNVDIDIKQGKMIITVDVGKDKVKSAPLSSKGKTKLLASTGGFIPVNGGPDGMKVSVLATLPKE